MLLNDYLNSKEQNRRILVVYDLGRGHDLIRKHEAITGELVRNVSCMTLEQMIDSIYKWSLSDAGYSAKLEELDSIEAMMLFRSVLLRNINKLKYFNQESILDIATTQEIFNKANLVRSNGWNGSEGKEDRIVDLKLLISEYEDILEKEEKLDSLKKAKLVLNTIRGWSDYTSELNNLFGAEIAYLTDDTEIYTGTQLEVLRLIVGSDDNAVSLSDKAHTVAELNNCKDKAIFFKGYGAFNEASYVASDILENNLPMGDVSILYSSSMQIPAITSALRGNGIRMNIHSKYNAKDNAYIALVKRILEWAAEDYCEKALENVMASPIISIMVDDGSGNEENILAMQSYFDFVSDAKNRREDSFVLGWGFERNNDFIIHEKATVSDEKVTACLNMLSDMLAIFSDAGKPYNDDKKTRPLEIYKKLVDFVCKYCRQTEEYPVGIEAIKRLSGAIAFEERMLTLDENLKFIDELLSAITISDGETSDAVSVCSLNDWVMLERPYVYVIGLSLKDMQGNTTQSPVLFDEEMLALLNEGYKPTIKAETDRRENNLYRTLLTFNGENISFGYSSYDTVSFCESNPSSFYRELLSSFTGKVTSELCEFVYGNPKIGVGTTATSSFANKSVFDIKHETSNSALEAFLECPKKYAYDKLTHIPDEVFAEKDYSNWLNAAQKGNFFHEIAEKYVSNKLIKKGKEAYDCTVDETLIRQLAEKIKKRLLCEIPVAVKDIADRETENMVKDTIHYFEQLLLEFQNDTMHPGSFWRALATEQHFSGAEYSVVAYDGVTYDFTLTGYIDRIDYRMDRTNEKVYLRIVDYKTGKRESKEKANELGKLIQYAVYEKALMESGKIMDEIKGRIALLDALKDKVVELEEDAAIASWTFEFETFEYVFPMERKNLEPIVIDASELEDMNVIRLKSILTLMKKLEEYPSHEELYNGLDILKNDYPTEVGDIDSLKSAMTKTERSGITRISSDEIKHCDYCSYCNLCVDRKVEI